MFEKPSSTVYDDYVVANVNLLLSELFDENNQCRYFNGKKALTEVPYVNSREDELVYEDEYINDVMPKGLASKFFVDDDLNKFNIFNTYYNNARADHNKIVSKDVIDKIEAQ